jgi:hypothetical protein
MVCLKIVIGEAFNIFNTFMVDLRYFNCSMDASVNCVEIFASETEAYRVDWIEVRKDHEGYLG